jgi:hypothetical protein
MKKKATRKAPKKKAARKAVKKKVARKVVKKNVARKAVKKNVARKVVKKKAARKIAIKKRGLPAMKTTVAYQDKPWLAFYDKGVPATIKYKENVLTDYLEDAARDFPNKIAFISQDYKISYKDLRDMAYRFATCLADFGVRKGDSVAIHLPNMIQTVAAFYAILKLGGKVVMNNPLYSETEL